MLKLNVGFTKKVGEANYGSRGAAVNLELEFDSSLVGDAERLRERIKQLIVGPSRSRNGWSNFSRSRTASRRAIASVGC